MKDDEWRECVCERERERVRQRDREREREREKERWVEGGEKSVSKCYVTDTRTCVFWVNVQTCASVVDNKMAY